MVRTDPQANNGEEVPKETVGRRKRRPFLAIGKGTVAIAGWVWGIIISSLIISILLFIVYNFYISASIISVDSFFYIFLVLSVLTDGLFILIHLPRKAKPHKDMSFDPSKLTILIVCYNGEDVIEETIRQANIHVPVEQIYVVSDASTDRTVTIAHAMGVKVFQNRRNVNKAFSINAVVKHIKTSYTLILDDDTLIGDAFLPTSLMDDGYAAVAFNVMPQKEDNVLNSMQRFEYRKSMQIGKSLRSRVNGIGNVSGAIGLFRTEDLEDQSRIHSGQFGGEDEQRTALVHLYSEGKGVTYTDSTVLTKAPATFKALLKQRTFSWNISVPELFYLNWRIMLHPRQHYLLKAEKAYQMYIFLTDPLRILFFWILFTQPTRIFASYGFYLALTILIWLKTKREDKLWVILAFPMYSLLMTMCRLVSHFYWFLVKFRYIFIERFHRLVPGRKLLLEYCLVFGVIAFLWTTSIQHFSAELELSNKIQASRIDTFDTSTLDYEQISAATPTPRPQVAKADAEEVSISIAPSDTKSSLANKAITAYLVRNPGQPIADDYRGQLDQYLATLINLPSDYASQPSMSISIALIERAMREAPRT